MFFATIYFSPPETHAATYTVTGTVFNDSNLNGLWDSSEMGYKDVTVTINHDESFYESVTTAADGTYSIPNLSGGLNYSMTVTLPDGYIATTLKSIQFSLNTNITQNFGIAALRSGIPNNALLTDIACPNSNGIFCIAVGIDRNTAGSIVLTTADGTNWTSVSGLPTNSTPQSIACPNSNGIFCIGVGEDNHGNGVIMSTTDGINWTNVTNTPNLTRTVLTKIICPNSNGTLCLAVGGNGSAIILTSTDGINWTSISDLQNYPTLSHIACPDSNGILCIAVGYSVLGNSTILTTTDGTNWTNISTQPNISLTSIACPNSNGVFCIAVGYSASGTGPVLTTTDGTNWISVSGLPTNTQFSDITCPNSNGILCVAVGSGSSTLFTAADGVNWTSLSGRSIVGLPTYTKDTFLESITCPNSNGKLCITVGTIDNAAAIGTIPISTDKPPSINQIQNVSVNEGDSYTANGSFTDPDSTSWVASVDYGDGSTSQPLQLSGMNFTFNHIYHTVGTYTVTIYVTDNQGLIGTATATVIVNNPQPPQVGTITLSSNPVKINNSTTAITSFIDPAGGSSDTASWNWGDGSTSSGTVSESNGSGSVGPDSHTYMSLGSYIVMLTVTNGSDNLNGTSQAVIAVVPASGLRGANLTGKNYSGADLSGQNISGSNLSNGTFNNVNFSSANLSGSNGSLGSYISSNFTSANLTGGNFSRANFTGSNFTNAILTGANVSNANFTNVNLTGANLKGASFHGTTITGATWSNTICPNGTNSNNDGGTCVGQGGGL